MRFFAIYFPGAYLNIQSPNLAKRCLYWVSAVARIGNADKGLDAQVSSKKHETH
jgi:hypothetical protein